VKLGWNDQLTPILAKRKADGGLSDRDDIQTIAHYIDVDEGRLA
jgi:gluconokinase